MLRPGGYFVEMLRDGSVVEHDTFTCAHGNEIVKVPPGTASVTVGSFCKACGRHICDKCARKMERTGTCRPFQRWLDRVEGKDHARKLQLEAEKREELEDRFRREVAPVVMDGIWPGNSARETEAELRARKAEFDARVSSVRAAVRVA